MASRNSAARARVVAAPLAVLLAAGSLWWGFGRERISICTMQTAARAQTRNLVDAVAESARRAGGALPRDLAEILAAPGEPLLAIDEIPSDPWGNPYALLRYGDDTFAVHSCGADEVALTEDDVLASGPVEVAQRGVKASRPPR